MAWKSNSTIFSGYQNSGFNVTVSGISAGDILVFVCVMDYSAAVTFTWPSGFTEQVKGNITRDGQIIAVATKKADGTEGALSTTANITGYRGRAVCMAYRGEDSVSWVNVVGSLAVNNSANTSPVTVTASSVTPTSTCDLLYIHTMDTTGSVYTSSSGPSGFVMRLDTGAADVANLYISDKSVTAGVTGTLSATATLSGGDSGWGAVLLALTNAAAGGTISGSAVNITDAATSVATGKVKTVGTSTAILAATIGSASLQVVSGSVGWAINTTADAVSVATGTVKATGSAINITANAISNAVGSIVVAPTFYLSMPSSPGFTQAHFALKTRTKAGVSPLDGSMQVLEFPGAMWTLTASIARMKRHDAAIWQAFFLKLRGMSGRFYAGDPSAIVPRGTAAGSGLVNGSSQTGTTLETDGWTANQLNLFEIGDYFQIGYELKMITQVCTSDSLGAAVLTFEPPLRTSPNDNTSIIVRNPHCVMRLVDDNPTGWDVEPGGVYTMVFSAVESWS